MVLANFRRGRKKENAATKHKFWQVVWIQTLPSRVHARTCTQQLTQCVNIIAEGRIQIKGREGEGGKGWGGGGLVVCVCGGGRQVPERQVCRP